MHGELPRQIWAKTSQRNRRYLALCLILIVVAGALFYVFGGSSAPTRTGRFGADGGPVPVLAVASAKATCRSIWTQSAPPRRSTP